MRGTWIDMSKEERESAGLQEGPAQVPRIERHTWGLQLYISYYMIIIILYCAHYPKLNDTCHMHIAHLGTFNPVFHCVITCLVCVEDKNQKSS